MTAQRFASLCEDVLARIGRTPMRAVKLRIRGEWRTVHLKLDGCNPAGSSKDRTAASLLQDLETRGLLTDSSIVIESTSGNLGVALAFVCSASGYGFRAIIDPKTTPENRCRIQALGGELELVEEPDHTGGYLLSRLRRVRELCDQSPRYVWTNQYASAANPRAHYGTTGPEMYRQLDGDVDAIFVAVSTGGTLAGVGRYFREVSPHTRIIAVDAYGSVIFGGPPRPRKLTGIGSSQPSAFVTAACYDSHVLVTDAEAFALCRHMDAALGLRVGGSSGATVFACAQYLAAHPEVRRAVCLCPDRGSNYASTIFSDEWLLANGVDLAGAAAIVEDIDRGDESTDLHTTTC